MHVKIRGREVSAQVEPIRSGYFLRSHVNEVFGIQPGSILEVNGVSCIVKFLIDGDPGEREVWAILLTVGDRTVIDRPRLPGKIDAVPRPLRTGRVRPAGDVSHPGVTSVSNSTRWLGSSMYVCQICGGMVPPRTPAIRVIVDRRPKQYPFRHHANVFHRPDSNGKVKEHTTDDRGGVGWEIAREVLSCAACVDAMPTLE